MALTRIALINHVLNQSQLDSSYQTLARTWLNILRRKYADDTDFKIWRKTAANVLFISGQNSYSLPTDFARVDSCFLIGETGQKAAQIFIYDSYEFDPYPNTPNGDPSGATIDELNKKIVFNTFPNSGKYYQLNYFYTPTDYSTDNTDDNVVPDFPNQNLLIQEMILLAYENRDDERYQSKAQEAQMANVKHQRNASQNPGTSTLQLNQAHFRSRRRRW
jgi:hypothetical protein